MGSPVRGSDRVVRFSTKTDSLAEVEMDGDVVGSLEAEARSISAAEQGTDQQRQQLQRETRPNDHSSQANRPEPYGRFLFAEEIKASALTVPF